MSVVEQAEHNSKTIAAGVDVPARPPARGWAARLKDLAGRASVGTVLAGLASVPLTLWVFPPPSYGDASWVWQSAKVWPDLDGNIDVTGLHHAMRLGTVLPTRLAQEVFGQGQIAWVVTSIVLMAVFTAGIYAAGRALFNGWVGAAAVGLLLIHPFFTVVNPYGPAVAAGTGSLLPDAPAGGLFALGVAALVVASRRAGGTQTAWLAAAGLCWGLAYLTREYVAFMYLAIPLFFLLTRVPLRRMVAPAVPMLAVLGAEIVHNAIVWQDPLARLVVAGEHSSKLNPSAAGAGEPVAVVDVLLGFVRSVQVHRLGWFFVAALALTVVGVIVFRDRRLMLLLTWFLALWAPLTVLGGLIDAEDPTVKVHIVRYWYVVFPPLLVGALGTVQMGLERLRGRIAVHATATLALTAVLAVFYVAPAIADTQYIIRDKDWRELRGWLRDHRDVPVIYTDDRAGQTADFYVRSPGGERIWHGEIRTFSRHARTLPDRIGHHVYLQTKYGGHERPDPAKGWHKLWESENRALVLWQR